MTSRRAVLTALGTVGGASLAGCASLPFGDDQNDEERDVSLPADAIEPIAWPDSPFPVAVPAALADAHHDRARELLAAVPSDPSVPNAAIASDLQSERERTAGRLDDDVDEPWPTRRLSQWRDRRQAAATVRGAYRAATGEGDADRVTERRRSVRESLHSFMADHEYRASSAVEAVLAHAPIEELVTDCRRRTRPTPTYPADPVAAPFEAGDAVGRVERADAALADARRLRETYLTERADVSPHWVNLIDASDRLRLSVARTRSTVRDFLDRDEPPFEADLSGTVGRQLFEEASQRVEWRAEEHDEHRADGEYATAIIEAGRTLAAIEALRAAIDGIREGAYQDEVTVDSATRRAEQARDALAAIEGSEDRRLATQIAHPALTTVDYLPEFIEEGYADATRVQGELAWAELFARAVPAATAFVTDRLG